jgi:hypothetical protein
MDRGQSTLGRLAAHDLRTVLRPAKHDRHAQAGVVRLAPQLTVGIARVSRLLRIGLDGSRLPEAGQTGSAASQTFCAVRRQRLQALILETLPSGETTVIGWRFGSHRRSARLRFIPTDWGFQPVSGRLPQMSQTRAMVEFSLQAQERRRHAPERPRW